MKNKKKLFLVVAAIPLCLVLIAFIVLLVWGTIYCIANAEQYRRVYRNPLTITATVTHYESYYDETELDYYSYISYTVNGQKYSNKRYESTDEEHDLTPIGQQVQVRVSPEDPGKLLYELKSSRLIILLSFFSCFSLTWIVFGIRSFRLEKKQDGLLSKDSISQDLKLAIRARFFRVFWLFLAASLLFLCLRYPMLFGMGWCIACGVLGLFWLICMYTTTRDYRKVENEDYTIQQSLLEHKEIEYDYDGNDSYVLEYRSSGDLSWKATTSKDKFYTAKKGSIAAAVYLNGRKKPIMHYLGQQ